jgi:hypothetical protein
VMISAKMTAKKNAMKSHQSQLLLVLLVAVIRTVVVIRVVAILAIVGKIQLNVLRILVAQKIVIQNVTLNVNSVN